MIDAVFCFDFGAGSVRLMAVLLSGEKLEVHEIARFANEPQHNEDAELCWQYEFWYEQIWQALKQGFSLAQSEHWRVLSIGVDTWGADMVYFTQKNSTERGSMSSEEYRLLQAPYCYRDERMKPSIELLPEGLSVQEIYRSGGNAYFSFNSIYQLYHDYHYNQRTKGKITKFLFTPDYLCALLSGGYRVLRAIPETTDFTAEYCIASTSGLCDARQRNWNWELIDRAGLERTIFPQIVEAPYFAGNLAVEFGGSVPIIKVASHDTAAAVSSTALGSETCYLNCGTWFLLGIESPQACLSEEAFRQGIVNEGNPACNPQGQQRIMKMFCGFWLLQQLRQEWNDGADEQGSGEAVEQWSYAQLSSLAAQSRLAVDSLPRFDVNDTSLSFPVSMEAAITALLPEGSYSKGDLLRIVYYNMARACQDAIQSISKVSGRTINEVLLLGGGSQDSFFRHEVQRICQKRVERAAIEASVLGNAGLQFLYHQKLASLAAYREIVRANLC